MGSKDKDYYKHNDADEPLPFPLELIRNVITAPVAITMMLLGQDCDGDGYDYYARSRGEKPHKWDKGVRRGEE